MNTNGKEIERKYLIKYPDLELLGKKSFSVKEIVQTYLSSEKGIDRRVRSSRENGTVTYTFTEKRKITDLTRFEDEREISREEYEALLTTADGDFDSIYKTRYCIEAGERVAEVDVYKDVSDFAICEVELCDENESVTLPDCITLIREISGEKKYTNRYMAKRNK